MKSIPLLRLIHSHCAGFASEYVILDCDIVPAVKYSGNNVIKRQIRLDESSSKVVDTETRINGTQKLGSMQQYLALTRLIGHCIGDAMELDTR